MKKRTLVVIEILAWVVVLTIIAAATIGLEAMRGWAWRLLS